MWFNRKLDIVVTGAKGQLGSYLVEYFRKDSLLEESRIGKVYGIDIEDLDLTNRKAVIDFFAREHNGQKRSKIDYVIHCAAATDTAVIERDPSSFYAANCLATKNVADACAKNGIKLVAISTDYVLSEHSKDDGNGHWLEFPVNQYGMQKLVAELFIEKAFKDKQEDYLILRSSWMFGNSNKSFVEKMLTAIAKAYAETKKTVDAKGKAEVKVVDDAFGRPTPVWFIADTIMSMLSTSMHGTYDVQYPWHQVSRYDWAVEIWRAFLDQNLCEQSGFDLLEDMKKTVTIERAKSRDFGLGMKHPGAVGNAPIDDCSAFPYEECTQAYISSNYSRLLKLVEEAAVGEK